MNKLFDFIKEQGSAGEHPEEILFDAKQNGIIQTLEYVGSNELQERRWGRNTQYVYKVDDRLIAIEMYVMYSENGEDVFESVYEVEPYEVTVTKYRRIND